jgi:dihydroorotase
MEFDLLIRGGEVVDPGAILFGRLDVGIIGDRIAAVDRDLPANLARTVIDATGCTVTPGIIDLHTHAYWGVTYFGIEPDPIAARTGVTTWVDAGTSGAFSFPGFRRYVVEASQARVFAFLNVSSVGLVALTNECANMGYCDPALAIGAIEANRDVVKGVKVRMDASATLGTGVEALRRARGVADAVGLPVMVHIAQGPPELADVISLLRPGDILTHCFTGYSNRIVDENGKLLDCVRRLWDQGLILDVAHGTGSFSYTTAEAMLAAGLPPDVISTDMHQLSVQGPMYDLPIVMSKFLSLGMSLADVVKKTTSRPAEILGEKELGTLRPGARADVALFQMDRGDYTYYDSYMQPRQGRLKLQNTLTIAGGKVLERVQERPLAPWAELPEHQRVLVGQPHP